MKKINFLSLLSIACSVALVNADDLDTIQSRRYSNIVGATTGATSIATWLSTLGSDGKWPDSDIDYTVGCDAQTANWPIQEHWSRITTFSAAWHGGLNNAAQWFDNSTLRTAISLAMNYWFENDFTDPSCLDSGGTSACPCGTPGFWNENWYSNIILIPGFVGESCLLLGSSLSSSDLANCTHFTGRAYNTFLTGINGVSAITGSNTLDIASIGIDQALLTSNVSLLTDGYNRVHAEVQIENALEADGIRADGSFGQHAGIIYNGNYGKDYANDYFDMEIAAGGTSYEADAGSMSAFSVLVDAYRWMVYSNALTGVLHWDFSVLGRFITFAVADNQATENTKTNLTQLQVLGQEWGSSVLLQAYDDLTSTTTINANTGNITGNRMFYANDYMVQRGNGYVTTLRMFSNRTRNTECTNDENPFGFHLSDGTIYTRMVGNEYEDIVAAWDWNLIPGITVDYGATPLLCDTTGAGGTQGFVGGVSDGSLGLAAQRYETPTTKTLNWRKTFFFLPNDVQYVMVAKMSSTTSANVYTVLDQRLRSGDVYLNGNVVDTSGNYSSISTLYHGGIGYTFNTSVDTPVSLQLGVRTGLWSSIGVGTQGEASVDLFAAWLYHTNVTAPTGYAMYPATSSVTAFQAKVAATNLNIVRNDGSISALVDMNNNVAMVVFWETAGGSVTIPSTTGNAATKITSTGSANLIVHTDTWNVTLVEPQQILTSISLTFALSGSGSIPSNWGGARSKSISFTLPTGGLAGSAVTGSLV